jgi:hypothetical protein
MTNTRSPELANGKLIGPAKTTPESAHTVARDIVNIDGGAARVLRSAGAGWREITQYSAQGAPPR